MKCISSIKNIHLPMHANCTLQANIVPNEMEKRKNCNFSMSIEIIIRFAFLRPKHASYAPYFLHFLMHKLYLAINIVPSIHQADPDCLFWTFDQRKKNILRASIFSDLWSHLDREKEIIKHARKNNEFSTKFYFSCVFLEEKRIIRQQNRMRSMKNCVFRIFI